jgi:hypothetical protein
MILRYSGQERNCYSSEETKEYIHGLLERYLILYIKRVNIYVLSPLKFFLERENDFKQ